MRSQTDLRMPYPRTSNGPPSQALDVPKEYCLETSIAEAATTTARYRLGESAIHNQTIVTTNAPVLHIQRRYPTVSLLRQQDRGTRGWHSTSHECPIDHPSANRNASRKLRYHGSHRLRVRRKDWALSNEQRRATQVRALYEPQYTQA
jgi:hypothetical protein